MSEDKDKIRELMVELINALPGYTPFETPSPSSDPAMRFALASMYKDKGYRDYLIRQIRISLEGFQHVTDERGLALQQGRLLALKELLFNSKQMFQEAEKINKTFEDRAETGVIEL